jgi:hypothetical protein
VESFCLGLPIDTLDHMGGANGVVARPVCAGIIIMPRFCIAILVASVSFNLARVRGDDSIDFVRDIQPLLRQHCAECHGSDQQNGGLRMDVRASLFGEADSGRAAIVPGEPEQSELIHRVRSVVDGERMPPDDPHLPEHTIELLHRWIAQGAQWPQGDMPADGPLDQRFGKQAAKQQAGKDHWAFQPIRAIQPPVVNDPDWSATAIDRFLHARRVQEGLSPVALADPRTLIRRATYALTGLPPTLDEIQQFMDAESSLGVDAAFERLVDRLLNQTAYGQRWGRHWMDWVRYADTAGDNSDFPIPQAYLYRNYIVDSFNADLPYDRFVMEQIAGDLLEAETQQQRNRQTIATGYLAIARRFGSLVERYPWHLTIEDTIDNLGRTVLGMTLACARCHDHKFDPISTREYYGLYGFFASTRYPFPGIELFQTQQDFVPLVSADAVAQVQAPYQEKTRQLSSELERLLSKCEEKAQDNAAKAGRVSLAEQRKMRDELDKLMLRTRTAGTNLAKHLKQIPEVPTAYAVQDGTPRNARIQIKGEPDRPGAEVPRQFPAILGGQRLDDDVSASSSGRLQLAHWITAPDNPLTARVIVNRVWQRHFGTGLVSTTSDFGLRGEPASHPELLDWLAGEFIRSGWSIKQLHRTIMSSRTYLLSSLDAASNFAVDPQNRFLWKFNRQRLDAESIRDTLLALGGNLDREPQMGPYPIPPHKDWQYTQHHPFKGEYPNNKRSLYTMTKRLTVSPYYQNFDGPDPNVCTSNRDQSVTALQALYFTNDEFLYQQAERVAQKVLTDAGEEQQRMDRMFETILNRLPSSEESQWLRSHLSSVRERAETAAAGHSAESLAWSSLARSLLKLNEFLYVD